MTGEGGYDLNVQARMDPDGKPTVVLRLISGDRQVLAPLDPGIARGLAGLLVRGADRADEMVKEQAL